MSQATATVTSKTDAITFGSITNKERNARLSGIFDWAASLKEQPQNSSLSVSVTGKNVGSVATILEARDHTLVIDEPANLAGDDLGANPVEFALSALIACQVVTYRLWATKLDIEVDDIEITASGDIDTRGFFGIDDAVRPGFQGIQVQVRLSGPESNARYLELQDAVEAHCPVQDLFANPTTVKAELILK